MRKTNKNVRKMLKQIKREGEVATFLGIFEKMVIDDIDVELLKFVLKDFTYRYYTDDEFVKTDKDVENEPTLKHYMEMYEVKI
tara:strand:+ start:1178 stop:1426 length:249 start_codon:yes stop_codon:yes gene_type:complete